MGIFSKFFKSYSEKQIKAITPLADKVEALAEKYAAMSDEELRAMTPFFREQLAAGKTLDDILPDAFAVVREAAWRVLGKRPYFVQVLGGILIHQGRIAEMRTGEGKTLTETMPAYLNALEGRGVHIVTVNDYLAKRDSEWNGNIFRFLGMTVGLPCRHHLRYQQRVRLRLPPRQHGGVSEPGGTKRPPLRHRGRGGQHPHR